MDVWFLVPGSWFLVWISHSWTSFSNIHPNVLPHTCDVFSLFTFFFYGMFVTHILLDK